ncbi:hypothetical protein ADK60_19275, partial [Streptomyces sp. XY431]|uniref:peptidoglycan-binding protein n=1 Tax=Streptomyces sp. XY431 TaxID=1415562 RepID=UPI0006C185F7
ASPARTPVSASASATAPAVRPLRRGDEGRDVERLQDRLLRANCVRDNVPYRPGQFDAATADFLAAFQRAAGIRGAERDRGEYGDQTRAALEGPGARPTCRRP